MKKSQTLYGNAISPAKLRTFQAFINNSQSSKNAVSSLLEAAIQVNLKVTFNEHEMNVLGSNKIFACDVDVGGFLRGCRGCGSSKKEAKENAAKKAIDKLLDRESLDEGDRARASQTSQQSKAFHVDAASVPTVTADNGVNAVGQLQEFAASHQWKLPEYESIGEVGESHCKTFTIECTLRDWRTEGTSTTKKKAKQLAAQKMLQYTSHNTMSHTLLETPARGLKRSASTDGSPRMATRSSPKLNTGSFSSLISSNLESMALQDNEVHSPTQRATHRSDPDVKRLERKAASRGVKIQWKAVYDKGLRGNYLCFVRICSEPKVVCGGAGSTECAARANAAKYALECWEG